MGRFRVIDTDAHYLEAMPRLAEYFPEPWRTRVLAEGDEQGYGGSNLFPKSSQSRTVYGRIKRDETTYPSPMSKADVPVMMEHLGVDDAILISQVMLNFGRLGGDDERPVMFSNGYIDYMLEEVVDPDEGIYTLAPVPYHDPEAAADLLERVADERGIVGACVVTPGAEPPLGNRKYDVIYETAERLGLPLVFHGGGPSVDEYHVRGYEKFIETHTLGFLEANMSQLTSLVIQGTTEKFPDLDIVWEESGIFWVPMMMHRLDGEYLKRQSEAPLLTKRPSEYMQEFYYGIQPMEVPRDETYLEWTIEMLGGADRLLYASDYPHWDYDLPEVITDRPFLDDEEKAKILGGNAAAVFDL